MNVVLYMAMSLDGFIATKDGNSDWVSELDSKIFDAKIQEAGCLVVGKKTFDQYQGVLYPVSGVTNVVLTTEPRPSDGNVLFAASPKEALRVAQEEGHDNVLLIGGGHTNGAFLFEGLVNELIVTVYPLLLGEGIRLFEGVKQQAHLTLLSSQELGEGLVQLHFRVC